MDGQMTEAEWACREGYGDCKDAGLLYTLPDRFSGGAKPTDPELYEKAKRLVYPKFKKPSAYRSGALVKKYKELGGTYEDDGEEKTLKRWFKEDWKDVGQKKGDYPLYRPTKRISKKTPLIESEIDPKNLKSQDKAKQKIKGSKNLKPFKAKASGIMANSQFYRTDPKRGGGFFDDIQEAMNPSKPKERTFAEKIADVLKNPATSQQEAQDKIANLGKIGAEKLFDVGSDYLQKKLTGNGKKEDIQEAGSSQTNAEVAEVLETPMGNEDISYYFPNARYVKYSELKNYRSITDILPKNGTFFILLYEHKPNVGHWVLITRYNNIIENFDSYGLEVSKPLTWNRPEVNMRLGQDRKYLDMLFDNSRLPVIVNRIQFQSKTNGSTTCGAWDVLRQLSIEKDGTSLQSFQDKMKKLKDKTGLSYDDIVSNLISKR